MKIHINHSDLELDVNTANWTVPVYNFEVKGGQSSELCDFVDSHRDMSFAVEFDVIIKDENSDFYKCTAIIDNYETYIDDSGNEKCFRVDMCNTSLIKPIENQFLAARLNEFLPTDTRVKTKSERILFESTAITTIKNALENIHV